MESRNARLGLQLFCIYLSMYGGFVLINAFAPGVMEATPVAGINLAILCGFGLIVGALVMALIYGFLCTAEDADVAAEKTAASAGDAENASSEDSQ